jgi:predicted nucleotidyltransferase
MLEDFNKYKVLKQFFLRPTKKHQLRELSRQTGVSYPSVRDYTKELVEDGFIKKVEEGTYPGYKADMNEKFKLYKKNENVRMMQDSGLVEDIEKEFRPNAIVLFGSAARGEDTEKSDIDILIVAKERKFETGEYEEKFQREVNLQFMTQEDILDNTELSNSLANGIVLKGFLKVK